MRGMAWLAPLALLTTGAAFGDDVTLPDGKAKTIIENACADCHGLEEIVNNPMSSEKWRSTVKSMVSKGASLSPADIDAVVDYLSVYFVPEPVNVNTATAKEIQTGLDLTADEAAAIVAYRKANGNFKDFAGLQKVPGVNPKKLEPGKERIVF